MKRLVVMASGEGTTFQAILNACSARRIDAGVQALGTDRHGTGAERRARAANIPVFKVILRDYANRAAFSRAVAKEVASFGPDLLVLAGYMKILGPEVFDRFPVVNTHPSLLPAFPNVHAIKRALAYGVKVTGATVHWVNGNVDGGPIIAQVAVEILPDDTEDSLRERIQDAERSLYVDAICTILANK